MAFQGLNPDGMRFIRELGMAAAKARGGTLYASLDNQDWREIPASMDEYIRHAATAPTLYACRPSVSQNLLTRKLEDFHDNTDVAVEFWKHSRNFFSMDAVHRVAGFVRGADEIVIDQTRDDMLNVVKLQTGLLTPGMLAVDRRHPMLFCYLFDRAQNHSGAHAINCLA